MEQQLQQKQQKSKEVDSYLGGSESTAKDNKVDPKLKRQVDNYSTVLMELLHGEKTRDKIMNILESGEGEIFTSVPDAAIAVNTMAANFMESSGQPPTPGVQLGASPGLINDLIELGVAKGLWEPPDEEEQLAISEDTYQIFIEKGLADGSIDPVQLQLEVEPLMNEQQRAAGNHYSEVNSLRKEPDRSALVEQYANQKVSKAEGVMGQKMQQKQQQGVQQQMPTQALGGGQ